MPAYNYKAFDLANHKLSGMLEAPDEHTADLDLRKGGLRPYFLRDTRIIRHAIKKKRRRRRVIVVSGATAIALSLVASSFIVGYAGREQPPDIAQYKRAGLLTDSPEPIIAKSDEEREFAVEILKIWKNFTPGVVTSIEVRKIMITIYVNRKINRFSDQDIETLATQTVKALHRRFSAAGTTLLLVRGNDTILEVRYIPLTKSIYLKSYN